MVFKTFHYEVQRAKYNGKGEKGNLFKDKDRDIERDRYRIRYRDIRVINKEVEVK